MAHCIVVRGRVDGEAQSLHLKHPLAIRVRDLREAHVTRFGGQNLVLCGFFHMDFVPKRVPHTVCMSERSNCQDPHPLGGACIGEFERADTSPPTIQLLVHLGISTFAAASDLTLRIALYVLLKLAVVPGLYTVVDAQVFDESVLIRLAHYHRKPLPE